MDDTVRVHLGGPDDGPQLLRWRNDPATISGSVSGSAVGDAEHAKWYAALLADPHRTLYIGEVASGADPIPIGMCRFDLDDTDPDRAEVSINLNPVYRGRGLAGPLLAASIDAYARDARRTIVLTATIRQDNAASLRLFAGAGFLRTGAAGVFRLLERVATSGKGPN